MIELCLADHLFSQSKLSSLHNYYYKEHESKVLTTDVRTLRCATEHMYTQKNHYATPHLWQYFSLDLDVKVHIHNINAIFKSFLPLDLAISKLLCPY